MGFPVTGALAPDFILYNQHGEAVSLQQFRQQSAVVLYFYPKAMTPGCTTQACGIRDSAAALKAAGATVLAVSPDPVARLRRFDEKQELGFTLLSDEDHAITETYGCWGLKKFMGKEFMGVLRTTFIIDKAGKLRHIMDKVKTKTHHDDVLRILQGICD